MDHQDELRCLCRIDLDDGPVVRELRRHRVQVPGHAVTAVRERLERRLGVETSAQPEGYVWGIYFEASADIDLDFLRPDVLPPKDWAWSSHSSYPPLPPKEQGSVRETPE